MKKYKYSAINLNGKKFEGTFLAENEKDLRRQLAKQNLYLVSARPDTEKSPNPFFSLTGKVPVSELSAFCRQFSIMITSGTSIVDSLGILRSQSFSGYLRKVLTHVFEDVKAGKLLSEALDKHKRVFPDFFRSMVRVGELSGAIDKVLVAIADYYETDARMRARTRSALVYPAVLIVMAIGIIVLMVAFIIQGKLENHSFNSCRRRSAVGAVPAIEKRPVSLGQMEVPYALRRQGGKEQRFRAFLPLVLPAGGKRHGYSRCHGRGVYSFRQ